MQGRRSFLNHDKGRNHSIPELRIGQHVRSNRSLTHPVNSKASTLDGASPARLPAFQHAAQCRTHHHDCRRAGAGTDFWLHRGADQIARSGGLPARRHRDRPLHAGFRGRYLTGRAAGRNRRDAADVWRRAAFFARRSAVGQEDRTARRGGADRRGHGDGHGPCALVGLEPDGGHRVRTVAVGGEHGGAVEGAGKSWRAGDAERPYRGGLAGGRRSGDGPGPGAVAAAGGDVRRAPRSCKRPFAAENPGAHPRRGGAVHRFDAGGGTALVPLAVMAGGAHRLTRTVHVMRGGRRARHRLRVGGPVRRVVRAGRILRRHGAARIGAELSRCRGIAAAARCLRGAVLRLGRHAVRSACH